jgi:hypothetical protein
MVDTLRWNGHENFDFKCLHSNHCRYVNRFDENGESIFGKLVYDFIEKTSRKEAE